jgi:hypothetical protein
MPRRNIQARNDVCNRHMFPALLFSRHHTFIYITSFIASSSSIRSGSPSIIIHPRGSSVIRKAIVIKVDLLAALL